MADFGKKKPCSAVFLLLFYCAKRKKFCIFWKLGNPKIGYSVGWEIEKSRFPTFGKWGVGKKKTLRHAQAQGRVFFSKIGHFGNFFLDFD